MHQLRQEWGYKPPLNDKSRDAEAAMILSRILLFKKLRMHVPL